MGSVLDMDVLEEIERRIKHSGRAPNREISKIESSKTGIEL